MVNNKYDRKHNKQYHAWNKRREQDTPPAPVDHIAQLQNDKHNLEQTGKTDSAGGAVIPSFHLRFPPVHNR